MRRTCVIPILIALSACSPPRRPALAPQPSAADRLAAVDVELRAGCLECLVSAYRQFDALRQDPAARDGATAGAVRAAALIALRERELGMEDEGFVAKAREIAATAVNLPSWLPKILDVIDAMPFASIGAGRPTSDVDLDRMRIMRSNYAGWSDTLREAAGYDEAAAYAWLSLTCGASEARNISRDDLLARAATFADTPLIRYRTAICRALESGELDKLWTGDARFHEIAYHLGLAELRGGGAAPAIRLTAKAVDASDAWFQKAYEWHPRWPTLTLAMANNAMTAEEFAIALARYDDTLAVEPAAVDALLGKVRALSFLGRHEEAIAVADALLALRWYVGDARYWRALNENQLGRLDIAWEDIELAEKLLLNADAPKLAGIIAYRRTELPVARDRFELSRKRNPRDCETGFYLGAVLGEQREWAQTVDVLTETVACLDAAEAELVAQIERIRASDDKLERKPRQIAKREGQIAEARRMRTTSWFNIAVACFNLSRRDEARQYAEKVADDEQFGARAKEILALLR
jgi:tetratricopeptide (TPR) repeat protein